MASWLGSARCLPSSDSKALFIVAARPLPADIMVTLSSRDGRAIVVMRMIKGNISFSDSQHPCRWCACGARDFTWLQCAPEIREQFVVSGWQEHHLPLLTRYLAVYTLRVWLRARRPCASIYSQDDVDTKLKRTFYSSTSSLHLLGSTSLYTR